MAAAGEPVALDRTRRYRRIEARRGFLRLNVDEIWRYRELLVLLFWRDVRVRYKQTFLGASWSLFRPVMSIVIFSVIFGGLAGIKPQNGVPYPIFVGAGVVLWTYFSSALSGGSSSIVANASLVTKAHFPRLYIPLVGVAVPAVDAFFSLLVLGALFAWYGRVPAPQAPLCLLFFLLSLLIAFGIGLWLSAVNVRYRDILFAIPFLLQIWMYVSPVIYPVALVPERFHWLLALNPMTGALDGFRWSLLGGPAPGAGELAAAAGVGLLVLLGGLVHFHRSEARFADVI